MFNIFWGKRSLRTLLPFYLFVSDFPLFFLEIFSINHNGFFPMMREYSSMSPPSRKTHKRDRSRMYHRTFLPILTINDKNIDKSTTYHQYHEYHSTLNIRVLPKTGVWKKKNRWIYQWMISSIIDVFYMRNMREEGVKRNIFLREYK